MNDRQMHFEHSSYRFGQQRLAGRLSSGAITRPRPSFRSSGSSEGKAAEHKKIEQVGLSRSQSMRADGEMMEKMDFDSVYNLHTSKDTQSAIGKDFIPTLDRGRWRRAERPGIRLLYTVKTRAGRERHAEPQLWPLARGPVDRSISNLRSVAYLANAVAGVWWVWSVLF